MFMTKTLATACALLGLALSGPAFGAAEHSHDNQAATVELTLDKGKKWSTDNALRRGMGEMRTMLVTSLGRIHAGQFTPADYAALADGLRAQVDYIIANCKLPEEADAQLHVVLEEILGGMEAMRTESDRLRGVLHVSSALDAYARHFDHPDWYPIPR